MFWRIALVLLLVLPSTPAFAAKKIKVRAGTVAPEGTPWEQQIKTLKKHYRKDSGGILKLKVFLGGAKGDEKSLVRQCKNAKLELIGVSTAALATEVPELQALELPFLFDSTEEADFVLDNYIYDEIKGILAKYGFVLYQWAENGWQNIGLKNGFVKSPKDLKGRKIRSQEAPVHLATWKAFGASPTEMPVSEVLQALNTGRVDGFAQTPLFSFAAAWYRGIKYYTVTKHVYQPGLLVYSKKWFDKQAVEIQEALLANVEKDTKKGRKGVRRLEPGLMANFKNYGIKIYELNQGERNTFLSAARKVRKEFEKTASPDALSLLKRIDEGKAAFKKK